jgi:hypothetical protein
VDSEQLVELDLAGAPFHVDASQPDDRVSQVTNLRLLEAKHLPGLPQRGGRLGHLLVAPIDRAFDRGRAGGLSTFSCDIA